MGKKERRSKEGRKVNTERSRLNNPDTKGLNVGVGWTGDQGKIVWF